METLSNALDTVTDTVGGAVDTVTDKIEDGIMGAFIAVAEKNVKKYTQRDIKVEVPESIPHDWKDWMRKTGLNSICCDDTWDFLDFESPRMQKRVNNWNDRGIDTIVMAVHEKEVDKYEQWRVCEVSRDGSTMTISWWPRALNWASDSSWEDPTGSRCWWIIRDEIVFGLDLYELDGKCFYKSGWMDNFPDVDPNSCLPNGKTEYRRWLQFRHWTIFWYAKGRCGWNYQYTRSPPKNPDGSLFTLDTVLSLPDMPSMPTIKLPELPDVDLPTIEAPTIEAPTIEAPSLEAPSVDLSAPSMDARKERPENPWACHGCIELDGLMVKVSGASVTLSDATVHHFWNNGSGGIKTEKEEHQKFELRATSAEQAESWKESLLEVKVKEGEAGCCTIA